MIIIVESGSTKTDWSVVDKDSVIQVVTGGYNPYYFDVSVLEGYIKELLLQLSLQTNPNEITSIYFYGSGCSSEENYKKVSNALKKFFPKAMCFIYHDLLASARAVLEDKPGIACILGTGSNSCLYNGKEILENVPSVGWLIGDEGSGVYLGKLLITDYLRFALPENINFLLEKEYFLSFETVLSKMYSEPQPNNFFASFPPFIAKYIDSEYCRNLVLKNFEDFYFWQISKYTDFKNEEIGFVGSIAYYFKDILKEWMDNKGLKLGKVYKAPMDGLLKYQSKCL